MLSVETIRSNIAEAKRVLRDKGLAETVDIDKVLEVDDRYLHMLQRVETHRALKNKLSENISKVEGDERDKLIEEATQVKEELKDLEEELTELKNKRERLLSLVPNLVHEDVPVGKDESENQVIRKWGEPREFDFEPKDHLELGEALNIIDTEKAAEVSGSRFNYLLGDAVLIQFGLIQFVLETLTNEKTLSKIAKDLDKIEVTPFIPAVPPVMVRQDVMAKMDRLEPRDDRYLFDKDGLALIGSAEHSLGPIHMDETLENDELPKRYIGYSTAFRREAGSYGKDTRGIIRVHQFDKLELESFTRPEQGLVEQDFLIAIQEYLLQQLDIPYQVVAICTGDMGKPDYRQIDLEAWIPSQKQYRETHTADYMTDYQSRRLNIRTEDGDFVHMNDATAIAIGRTLVAIMENYQKEDGSIEIPKVLRKYVGKKEIAS